MSLTEGDPQSVQPETEEKPQDDTAPVPMASLSSGVKSLMLPLGNDRFLVYNRFQGTNRVHIRQYERKNGVLLPGKVGVCMSLKRFASLRWRMPEIIERVKREEGGEDLVVHIGGNLHVTVQNGFACVNFRKFFFPPGEMTPRPSKFGIALRLSEFAELQKRIEELLAMKPELAQVELCSSGLDHSNQEGFYNCPECHFAPLGYNVFELC